MVATVTSVFILDLYWIKLILVWISFILMEIRIFNVCVEQNQLYVWDVQNY